jgi:3-methyl-2-oxobutanoate hydroxymethyltransferase
MIHDAVALQNAGADLLLLECVPSLLAAEIRGMVDIPVIGIGAGVDCDGQILVLQDVLGMTARPPKFARDFLAEAGSIHGAVEAYVSAVRERRFPGPEHGFTS